MYVYVYCSYNYHRVTTIYWSLYRADICIYVNIYTKRWRDREGGGEREER